MFTSQSGLNVQCKLKTIPLVDNLITCSLKGCPFKTKNYQDYKQHRRLHINVSGYTCKKCPAVFKQFAALRLHVCKNARATKSRPVKTREDQSKKIVCELCGMNFQYHNFLERHRKIGCVNETTIRFNCPHCSLNFSTSLLMERHKKYYCMALQSNLESIELKHVVTEEPKVEPVHASALEMIENDWDVDETKNPDSDWIEIIELKEEELDGMEETVVETKIKEEPKTDYVKVKQEPIDLIEVETSIKEEPIADYERVAIKLEATEVAQNDLNPAIQIKIEPELQKANVLEPNVTIKTEPEDPTSSFDSNLKSEIEFEAYELSASIVNAQSLPNDQKVALKQLQKLTSNKVKSFYSTKPEKNPLLPNLKRKQS